MTDQSGTADIVEALDDIKTHRAVWRSAIERQCTPFGSDDDGSYWDHELRAFDRTFGALASLQPATPTVSIPEIKHWNLPVDLYPKGKATSSDAVAGDAKAIAQQELAHWATDKRTSYPDNEVIQSIERILAALRSVAGDVQAATSRQVALDGEGNPVYFTPDAAQPSPIKAPGNDQLSKLWNAIVENTKGDGFWIGEILLTTLEREVGFNPASLTIPSTDGASK